MRVRIVGLFLQQGEIDIYIYKEIFLLLLLLKVASFSRITIVQELAKTLKMQYNDDDLNRLVVPLHF